MKLLFVSDFHHLNTYPKASSGYKSIFNDMENNLLVLKRVLEKEEFDLLIVGGDLCEDGDVSDYLSVKEVLSDFDYILTLGNHDIKENFYKAFYNKDDKQKFHHIIKKDNYTFISFDNSEYNITNGTITSSDIDWLKRALNDNQESELIVLMHHHLFEDQHDTKPIDLNLEIIELLDSYNVKLVMSAHTHQPHLVYRNKSAYVTSGSMAFRAYVSDHELVFSNERSYVTLDLDDEIDISFKHIKEAEKILKRFNIKENIFK